MVYVHELKKPSMCHVLIRDIISGALMHSYDVAEVTSCFAIWANNLSVCLAGKPRPYKGQQRDQWSKQPAMCLAVRDLDLSTVQKVLAHKGGHKEEIVCVAVSHDGARLSIGAKSGRISIYDCDDCDVQDTKNVIAVMAIPPDGKVTDLAFTPTNALLLLACGSDSQHSPHSKSSSRGDDSDIGFVSCFDTTDKDKQGLSDLLWRIHLPLPAKKIQFNPDGDTVCVCMSNHTGSTGQIYLLDPLTGRTVNQIGQENGVGTDFKLNGVISCTYQYKSVYGIPRLLASCGHGGQLNLWTGDDLKDQSDLMLSSHDVHCTTCAFSSNGMHFVSGDAVGHVILRQFCMSKNQVTLVQKQRWELTGPISNCIFLDPGLGRSTYMGFTYWCKGRLFYCFIVCSHGAIQTKRFVCFSLFPLPPSFAMDRIGNIQITF